MPKMTKNQLIDAVSESSAVSKNDVKAVMEHLATVGYKELNESGEFVVPGFVKMSVINKPPTEARSGINPFTKEPMEFGQTSPQDRQGLAVESSQGRGLINSV
jgi:DNA-binding protein HU-beta